MNIDTIIKGCIQEDRLAQQSLFDLNYQVMMRVALFYCKNQIDAENVVIESFMYVYKNISTFKGESKFQTWMRKIVVNKSITLYKNNIKRNEREISIDQYPYINEISSDFNIIGQLEAQFILHLIQNLPDSERLVFNLHFTEGYNHKEIGEILNIPESTSRWHYSKARYKLQNQLKSSNLQKHYK